jgi:transposase InsO family protein
MVSNWKKEMLEHLTELFENKNARKDKEIEWEKEQLHGKLGQLTMEVDFLEKEPQIQPLRRVTPPYRLRGLDINRPNQVMCADITYIQMHRGYRYLFAIIDWYSRKVIARELSNTLDIAFCLKCLKRALKTSGAPEIINDQGCKFTSDECR